LYQKGAVFVMSARCKVASPKQRRRCKSEYRTPPPRRSNKSHTITSCKSSKKKANICCICLEAIAKCDASTLDACDHSFHLQCITSWSHIENACPLCKTKFSHICHGRRQIAVSERKQEPAYQIELGNIIWVDCACVMCGSDDNEQLLLLCDGCDSAQHTYCVGLGDHVPDGDYYCDACKSRFGDLLEMGLSLDAIFTTHTHSRNSRDTASESRAESVLAVGSTHHRHEHDHHCSEVEHMDSGDEEYIPSPILRRRTRNNRKSAVRIHAAKQQRNHNRNSKSHSQRSAAAAAVPHTRRTRCHSSDEEYVPRSFDRQQQRHSSAARNNIRRSERIRKHNEQQQQHPHASTTADIDDRCIHSTHNSVRTTPRPTRARSMSPVSSRVLSNVAHTGSSLNELPSSSHKHCATPGRKKLVLVQPNGRKRLLLSKPPQTQNSLCKLFTTTCAPNIVSTAHSVAESSSITSILSQNTLSHSSSSSSLEEEHCDDESMHETEDHDEDDDCDDDDELFVPKERKIRPPSCALSRKMIMTRSMKRKEMAAPVPSPPPPPKQSCHDTCTESENDTDIQSALESEYVPSDASVPDRYSHHKHHHRHHHATRSKTAAANRNCKEQKCRKRTRQQMQNATNRCQTTEMDCLHARKRLKHNYLSNKRKYSSLSNL